MQMSRSLKCLFLAGLTLVAWGSVCNAQVRLHGATSEARTIKPKQAEIEQKSGQKIELVANSSGRGVEALLSGKADIAMVAGTLELNAQFLNADKPGSVDVTKLKEFNVFNDTLHPVANPSNPVDSLTLEQVKGMLTGKIKNWKEVGGQDQPIIVVMPQPRDGGRMTTKAQLLAAEDFVASTRVVASAPDVNKAVSQLPGGFSMLSTANKTDQIKTLKCDKYIGVVNSLVTVGEPAGPTKQVIDAIVAALKDVK